VLGKHGNTTTLLSSSGALQDLTKYFSRPVSITSGIATLSLRDSLFSTVFTETSVVSTFPNGLLRMTGVYGYRATLVFTLQVAATPFHQGLFCLNWQYNPHPAMYYRGLNSETSTNIPHVRLDLSTDTMVQLRVPFLHNYEYLQLRGNAVTNNYGIVTLNTLTPIPTVTGIVPPEYQILYHLEDIEFFGAAPNAVASVQLQAGGTSPAAQEFEKDAYPFSSAVHAMSRTVRYIAKGIPSVSSLAGPTVWFLSRAAGSIRSFGYSKPQIQDPVMRMITGDTVGECNVDLPSATFVSGPFQSNQIATDSRFGGTDIDEMSLRYIFTRYYQLNYFQYSTTDPKSTLIWAMPVTPAACWFQTKVTLPATNKTPRLVATPTTNTFIPTGIFAVASMCKFWRGSLKFRFNFTKTKMHGGRVMVVYNPGVSTNPMGSTFGVPINVLLAAYGSAAGPDPFGYSAIYNLRDGNVFEFSVPYMSNRPWLNFDQWSGTIAMYVVDAIQAPSIVSNTLQVLVEVSADSDFEVANPTSPIYPSYVGQTDTTVVYQSGEFISQAVEAIVDNTIGESLDSVKQLISIPKVTFSTTNQATPTAVKLYIPPWYYQPQNTLSVPATSDFVSESFGFGGNIATWYLYQKGGTDFHAYLTNGAAGEISVVQRTSVGNVARTLNKNPTQWPFTNVARVIATAVGRIHVRLPAYQTAIRYISGALNVALGPGAAWGIKANKTPDFTYTLGTPTSYYILNMRVPNAEPYFTSRAAADDAALAHYMGPPPFMLLASTVTTGLYDQDSDIGILG
jgi:hypothetical protein